MTWKMTGDITATDCDILHVMELQVLNGDLTFPVGSRLMTAELLGLESKTLAHVAYITDSTPMSTSRSSALLSSLLSKSSSERPSREYNQTSLAPE